jgi:hypothetical protein
VSRGVHDMTIRYRLWIGFGATNLTARHGQGGQPEQDGTISTRLLWIDLGQCKRLSD